jgi:hypothetical protein
MTSRRLDFVVAAVFAALSAIFIYKDVTAVKGGVLPAESCSGAISPTPGPAAS